MSTSGTPSRLYGWTTFECHADPGSEVFVAGTFNNWKPSGFDKLRDRKRDGTFRTLLQLRKGRHEYKYQVNGEWLSDTEAPAVNRVMDVS
jgi:1,4-alpha-glucan branching enzyme